MKIGTKMLKRIQKYLKSWVTPYEAPAFGQRSAGDNYGIHDGVDYSLPPQIPGSIAALDMPGTQAKFTEAVTAFSQSQSFRFQFDTPQRSAADMPVPPSPTDPLKEDNWQQRKMKLANYHNVFLYNPMANSALRYYADLVLGEEGFNLTCRNKDVEEILEDYICDPDNAIREREREFMTSLPLDGELFLRYFKGSGENKGKTVCVPLRPWECEFIDTDPDFFKRVNFYQFQFLHYRGDNPQVGADYERVEIPADEIQHVAINRLPYELRGRSQLEPVMPWLRAYKEFLENRARQNHWRTALLWLVQIANGGAAQIASVLSRWSKPPSPGTVAVESADVTVTPLVNPSGAGEANEDGRQIKLMILSCFHLPEYFFADGYNANLATATAQQLPALAMFESYQTLMIEQVWKPMFKRVLQNAIDAGLLPEEVEEQDADGDPIYEDPPPPDPNEPPATKPLPTITPMPMDKALDPETNPAPTVPVMPEPDAPPKRAIKSIDTLEAFDVSYAPVVKEDKLEQTKALVTAQQQDWISKKKAQIDFGVDPYIEDKQIEREKETQRMEMQSGMNAPVPGMPQMNPNDMQNNGQNAPKQPFGMNG